MIKVFNKATGEFIGRIGEADLAFLADQLEEESLQDTDYFLRTETVDQFVRDGASERLIQVLRGGMRHENSIEIRWERDPSGGSGAVDGGPGG